MAAAGGTADSGGTQSRAPNEVRALGALAFDELHRLPGAIRDMHLGIAGRAFRGVGPAAHPVRVVHDGVSIGAYGVVAGAAEMLGEITDAVLEWRDVGERLELSATRRGGAAIGAVNGLIGDRLRRQGSALHQPVSVRVEGQRVPLERTSLSAAFPAASRRLVVFLHGLMGTEFAWARGPNAGAETYGSRLAADLGLTPVQLRYNSGLHISENGRDVAELIGALVANWPVEVEEIALVGHSMGGLIARSACHQGQATGDAWVDRVDTIITLGTPHLGAPLEQGAHLAAAAFDRIPETRMLSAFLRRRSAGIRDLRGGSLVDEDWRGRDPEALASVACHEVPLLSGATHYFVTATITRDPGHPLGRLFGDVLVLVPSASGYGRTRRIPFDAEHGHHVGGIHHLALLNHPEVYRCLRKWLARDDGPGRRSARPASRALDGRP